MVINKLKWIWQQTDWPRFFWDETGIQTLLRVVRLKQGELLGKTGHLGEHNNLQETLDTLVQNILTSSEIEGERLNAQSIRSSLAKRLGISLEHPYPTSDRSEGITSMMLDAINNLKHPLTEKRLFQWHQWLFPESTFSVFHRIRIGEWRGEDPMQVVSGRLDKPKVHFEAPPRNILVHEMSAFLDWFNQSRTETTLDPYIRAAIAHFWFVTIHPFEDGNGRITRAITDLALAQGEALSIHFYAMSPVILKTRKSYYHILEQQSRSKTMDLTPWLVWFLQTLNDSMQASIDNMDRTLCKTLFWQHFASFDLSTEQRKVLNRLLDGGEKDFEQGINASQYQKVAKVSKATATRHLNDLLEKGCIEKLPGRGRNTRYIIHTITATAKGAK